MFRVGSVVVVVAFVAASCLVASHGLVVFVHLFKLFRLFSCVMARLCAIFISSK